MSGKYPGWYPPDDGGPIPVWWDGSHEETVQERLQLVVDSLMVGIEARFAAANRPKPPAGKLRGILKEKREQWQQN